MVLHYGSYEGSNDSSKETIIFRNNLLDNWNGINPDDPLSTVDKVAIFARLRFVNDLLIKKNIARTANAVQVTMCVFYCLLVSTSVY